MVAHLSLTERIKTGAPSLSIGSPEL
ncbi:MAG: hypothetical protein AVDCRST_MAG88-3659 [uncultured Thermomicrobiales bacterium]|uniref:Uncharacterized protein n=1 Tax=uncultured Thermomicrobiales bacterium TaxID=1645740 RepID=A0A6J4VSI9_9BACT|nr:MAG: hypothetical protein AVDCRST_MAG88-3659 [uncultured Thermomicrobiales bacterium]